MGLASQINEDIKQAMLNREKEKLEALRAVKSAFLMAATEKGAGAELQDDQAIKTIQKLVKQRRDSEKIYLDQNRQDLAADEKFQAEILEAYLPKQLDDAALKLALQDIIKTTGATSQADMGKVMGAASAALSGQADGKRISSLVRELLN